MIGDKDRGGYYIKKDKGKKNAGLKDYAVNN